MSVAEFIILFLHVSTLFINETLYLAKPILFTQFVKKKYVEILLLSTEGDVVSIVVCRSRH